MSADDRRHISVGQAAYEVRITRRIDSDKLGDTNTRQQRIRLSPQQSASSLRDTTLHEALHAVWYESSANSLLGLDDETEERIVRLITPWLLMLLRDNPELVDDLLS